MIAIFVGGIALLGLMFKITPTGFLPNEDQSLLYVLVTLTDSGLDGPDDGGGRRNSRASCCRMPQVEAATSGIGFGFANNSSNQATIFLQLKPLSERHGRGERLDRSAIRSLLASSRRCPGVKALAGESAGDPGFGHRPAASRSRSKTSTISAYRRSIRSVMRSSHRRRRIRRCRRCASRRSLPARISSPNSIARRRSRSALRRQRFFDTHQRRRPVRPSSTSSTTARVRIKSSFKRKPGSARRRRTSRASTSPTAPAA